MSIPPEPQPAPPVVGLAPANALAVNNDVGQHLRMFLDVKNSIAQDRDFLEAADLKVEPYNFTADQETLIKSAILPLDTTLDGVDMTFITKLIGLY